jgi:hypothetical protein
VTARAVLVVGKDGTLKHLEYVPEISSEPNYTAALAAARAAMSAGGGPPSGPPSSRCRASLRAVKLIALDPEGTEHGMESSLGTSPRCRGTVAERLSAGLCQIS